MKLNHQDFHSLLAADFPSFIRKVFNTLSADEFLPNWHIDLLAYELERCTTGDNKRLIINMPPRYMKSICASVALPAWILGHNPSAKIIVASYSQSLSEKHARDCRLIMESDWYKKCFPQTRLSKDRNSLPEFVTTKGGFRMATSVGGTLTGRGSNYIIIDDAHKPDEVLSEARRKNVLDWYSGTTLSRLDNKKEGVIILVSQRLHEDDLSGHLIAQGNWWHIKLPAIAEETIKYQISANRTFTFNEGDVLHPARESREMLDQLKRDMGSDIFAAQYQQRPNPLGGGMIKSDWFKQYDVLPAKPEQVVMSLDTACKSGELNDYSVCTIWHIHKNAYYLASIWRKRVDYPELKKSVKLLAEEHKPHLILIEDKASGIQLIQELRVETRWSVVDTNPELDKATRMSVHSASIEAGKVFLPKDAEWLDNFMHEILHFPKGKNDDQVDSLSQFLAWAWEHENNDFRHLVWSPASEKGFIPPHMRLL